MYSLRNIVKNLLPYFVTSNYQKRKGKNTSTDLTNVETGNSILLDNFSITVGNESLKKHLFTGNDNMLDCKIIIESDDGKVIIGEKVFIGCSTIICRSKIEFGSNIFVAWGVYFYDHDSHSMDYKERQRDIIQQLDDYRNGNSFIKNKNWNVVKTAPIKICNNVWIGMNAMILKGVEIGEGAIIGAGSVVTKNVAPWTVVAGNPARVVNTLNDIKKI